MNNSNHAFRDRLLAAEQLSPVLRESYEKEVQTMFNKPLTGVRRWSFLITTLLSCILAVVFAAVALLAPAEIPVAARVGLGMGAIFSLAWAVFGWRVLRQGSINLKTDSAVYYGLAWGLPLCMLTFFMVYAPNDLVGLRMITTGIAFLIAGAVFLLRGVVERSELHTREKLLEIEYRLAEIEELVKSPR